MKKTALYIAAAIALASAGLTDTAQAGGCGNSGFRSFGHGPGVSHRYQSSSYAYEARRKARAAAIAKKRALARKLAEKRRRIAATRAAAERDARLAEHKVAAAPPRESAAIDPPLPASKPDVTANIATPATEVAEARPAICKRYIPSAGLTISVPCQ